MSRKTTIEIDLGEMDLLDDALATMRRQQVGGGDDECAWRHDLKTTSRESWFADKLYSLEMKVNADRESLLFPECIKCGTLVDSSGDPDEMLCDGCWSQEQADIEADRRRDQERDDRATGDA